MRHHILLALLAGAFLSLGLRDATAASQDELSPEELLFADIPVVVSATRTERASTEVPSAVTVITAAEIHESGATSLQELLETVPGLDIMRMSRADLNVKSRGFVAPSSSYLLAMVDGRSVYLDFFGVTLWEQLNVTIQDIERIEVVRGPGSSLYGANAFLGTINIVTRDPEDLPTAYVRTGLGPDTRLVSATGSATHGNVSVKGSVEYRSLDEFRNVANPAPNIDRDRHDRGLLSRLINTTVEYRPDSATSLRVSGGTSRGHGNTFTSVGTFESEGPISYAKIDFDRGPWKLQAFYTRVSLDLDTIPTLGPFDPAPPPNESSLLSTVMDLELQRGLHWRQHELLSGFHVRRLMTDSDVVLGSREEETLYAGFLQDEMRVTDDLTAFLSVRFDEHPKSDFQISPRAALVYRLGETAHLRASYARSFQNPTHIFNYTTFAPSPIVNVVGNEDLDPAWVTAYELGMNWQPHHGIQTRVDLFFNVIEDFQVFTILGLAPPTLGFRNDFRTKAWGGEFSVDWRWRDELRTFANYSFQSANGPLESATPRHKASGGLRGSIGGMLRYALTGNYVGHTEFEPDALGAASFADMDIRSRFTVDSFLGLRLTEAVELGLHGKNIFHQVRRHHPQGDEIGSELLVTLTGEF